jgi:hypothetical protein
VKQFCTVVVVGQTDDAGLKKINLEFSSLVPHQDQGATAILPRALIDLPAQSPLKLAGILAA